MQQKSAPISGRAGRIVNFRGCAPSTVGRRPSTHVGSLLTGIFAVLVNDGDNLLLTLSILLVIKKGLESPFSCDNYLLFPLPPPLGFPVVEGQPAPLGLLLG